MGLSRNFRGCRASCADGPHWLVRKQDARKLLWRQGARPADELSRENLLREAGVTLLLCFSQANNGSQAVPERHEAFLCHVVIGLPEELAALGMPDDHVAAAGFGQHLG